MLDLRLKLMLKLKLKLKLFNRVFINDSYILLKPIIKNFENFKEPVDFILGEFKSIKSFKYKVTINFLYKKRKSEEEKNANINFKTEEYMAKDHL